MLLVWAATRYRNSILQFFLPLLKGRYDMTTHNHQEAHCWSSHLCWNFLHLRDSTWEWRDDFPWYPVQKLRYRTCRLPNWAQQFGRIVQACALQVAKMLALTLLGVLVSADSQGGVTLSIYATGLPEQILHDLVNAPNQLLIQVLILLCAPQ